MSDYKPIIGLEIHVELATQSKMFCGCKNDPFFASHPNIYTCPVCLGLPGGLPVANKKAIEWCMMLGLALGCSIPKESKFDRKNYFYPDLAKGYQISQYDQPLTINGRLVIASGAKQSLKIATPSERTRDDKVIRIRRVHMEEDTGKLIHSTIDGKRVSLVDFNRSGVPLVEIVTEPDFRTVEEVDSFLKKLQQIIRYLGISGADMEKGSMRLEPSISLSEGGELPEYRVELKNINSFRFVRKALEYEIFRQTDLLNEGERIVQQTRGWDETKGATVAQREKEEAHDYRYFPEPDIPPMRWDQGYINSLREKIPELPDEKNQKFLSLGLPPSYSSLASDSREMAKFFEDTIAVAGELQTGIGVKSLGDWIFNKKIDIENTTPAEVIQQIIKARTIQTVSNQDIEKVIDQVIVDNQKAVTDYRKGKEQALMFLFGQVNRDLKGKGEKQEILTILKKKLTSQTT